MGYYNSYGGPALVSSAVLLVGACMSEKFGRLNWELLLTGDFFADMLFHDDGEEFNVRQTPHSPGYGEYSW